MSEVVQSYIPVVTRSGRNWAKCPFHGNGNERTPSFAINDKEGFYHCFGCGESGDMFTFVEKMDHVSFSEAVEILAKKAGVEVPGDNPKGGIYKPVMRVGNMLYVSGQGCTVSGKPVYQGAVGRECTLEEGQDAAKLCAINALGVLQDYLGDLRKVKCLVKTLAFVHSAPDFALQHLVANGCSDFLKTVFGDDAGVGARSAIGVAQLPNNIPVEIEFVFEAEEE